jgi:hypothetical protein
MGINIPTYQELIANRIPMEEMADHFGKIGTSYYNDFFESTFLSTISVVLNCVDWRIITRLFRVDF